MPKHKTYPAHCYNCSERGHYGYVSVYWQKSFLFLPSLISFLPWSWPAWISVLLFVSCFLSFSCLSAWSSWLRLYCTCPSIRTRSLSVSVASALFLLTVKTSVQVGVFARFLDLGEEEKTEARSEKEWVHWSLWVYVGAQESTDRVTLRISLYSATIKKTFHPVWELKVMLSSPLSLCKCRWSRLLDLMGITLL